jgi:hypothetical protein
MPSANTITYEISMDGEKTWQFDVEPGIPAHSSHDQGPEWARLEHSKCRNCPLDPSLHTHCPPALGLADIIPQFTDISSVARVHVRVSSAQRLVVRDTDLQTALRSLIGLVMPTSGCPILGRLGGLARFHLPFADHDETVFRVVGGYLVEQYLVQVDGGQPDWALTGIKKLFEDVQKVDVAFADRIRNASSSDAGVNAVVALFSLATLVSMSLDDDLQRIRNRLNTDGAPS